MSDDLQFISNMTQIFSNGRISIHVSHYKPKHIRNKVLSIIKLRFLKTACDQNILRLREVSRMKVRFKYMWCICIVYGTYTCM